MEQFMEYSDPPEKDVYAVSFATGWGSSGEWEVRPVDGKLEF